MFEEEVSLNTLNTDQLGLLPNLYQYLLLEMERNEICWKGK